MMNTVALTLLFQLARESRLMFFKVNLCQAQPKLMLCIFQVLWASMRANSSLSCSTHSQCLLFSSDKEPLGPAVAGELLAVGAPPTWSGSTFGKASDSAC
jgi:hypothetical protein